MAFIKKGKRISRRQRKALIMKANEWTAKEYRNQYHIFKNKLRAFENFQRAHGVRVERQSPADMLYRIARAKMREGSNYRPSLQVQRILSFSAVSISQGKKLARDFESEYSKRRSQIFKETTNIQFSGLISKSKVAQEIVANIDDPVKREKALVELAEYIHAKQRPSGAFEYGEFYGSDEAGTDFDYSQYLED